MDCPRGSISPSRLATDGTWQAAITQGTTTTLPINYLLQLQMPYSALSPFTTNVIGSGQEKNGSLGTYTSTRMSVTTCRSTFMRRHR